MSKIHTLQIETTSMCNNLCKFCPHQDIDKLQHMNMNLFKKIIDEASELGIERIVPFLNGEPFCDPRIFERLDYIRKKMPNTFIELFTNGSLMTKEVITKLKEYNIGFMNVSINAASPETYEAVCGTKHYDKVVKNTIRLINELDTKIRVSFVPYSQNSSEIEIFKEMWGHYNCEVQVNDLYNWCGRIYKQETKLTPCFRIMSHMTVLADGRVNLCCMDNGQIILGDLNTEKIKEVWDKNKWRRIMHLQGKRPMMEGCSKCNM